MTEPEARNDAPFPFPYEGPQAWRTPIVNALRRVVDPEVAMSILDVGLIYGVSVADEAVKVRITMTSPACPVTDMIIEEVEDELDRALPTNRGIDVELCWEPAWTPERMSESAKRFMRW